MTDEKFVDQLAANSGFALAPVERAALVDQMRTGVLTRAQALLAVANNASFTEREANRSLVLLHYFGYLHRNPEDAPDGNLGGFNFWLKEVESTGEMDRLPRAFMASIEYQERNRK
jgi:hypothetical protein